MEEKIKKTVKPTMTADEFEQIKSDGEAANELLLDDRFNFFRKYLRSQKEAIVTDFVNNKIKKTIVVEKGERVDHQIIHEKREQENELSGKFKFIFEELQFLQTTADLPLEAIKARDAGSLVIEE